MVVEDGGVESIMLLEIYGLEDECSSGPGSLPSLNPKETNSAFERLRAEEEGDFDGTGGSLPSLISEEATLTFALVFAREEEESDGGIGSLPSLKLEEARSARVPWLAEEEKTSDGGASSIPSVSLEDARWTLESLFGGGQGEEGSDSGDCSLSSSGEGDWPSPLPSPSVIEEERCSGEIAPVSSFSEKEGCSALVVLFGAKEGGGLSV